MLSYTVPGENITVLLPGGSLVPHPEELEPPYQDDRKKGLKNEAKVLGTIQILSGAMIMSLGVLLLWTSFPHHFRPVIVTLVSSGYPFVGAKCFIISGLLCVILEKRSTKRLAWTSLVTSLLSLLGTFVGFIVILLSLAVGFTAWGQCKLDVGSRQTPQDNFPSRGRTADCAFAGSSLLGVLSVMLLFTVLELGVAVPSSILWWKQARSSIPGVVRFLAQSDTVVTNMLARASADPDPHPGFEEQLPSCPQLWPSPRLQDFCSPAAPAHYPRSTLGGLPPSPAIPICCS
ncbi:membrane-spanning 4-domains subfamily A member 6B-like isoform X1 [Equus asinus]|uniref:membrane-spanning 4-domains subfamily A member 6B-like isoform X1 n=1 Tax=Equus asinus TaxID=9793 RepID=UPI0038F7A796